ncbi:Hpt domain-containing protein [Marimonas arenosa]|uniref:Hpt domain-containing protein n=1 Tax=Marimonas arenosa TaxID=1795305 RepID=A0AAE3WBY7_9RHOB|nr:Hpt domain-containing protein [Marimonas arenosa]MDQ2090406.1 Hpt domain-containing protein [Marimonas arenosa]
MIDWDKVIELREEIGEEDFAEVVDLFLEEVDEAMTQLRAGLPQEKWECCLHFLKGSALNLGFEAFSTLCASGEVAAASGDHDEIDLAEVITTYDQSKATFLADLKDRLAA